MRHCCRISPFWTRRWWLRCRRQLPPTPAWTCCVAPRPTSPARPATFRRPAEKVVQQVFRYLPACWRSDDNLQAREKMQRLLHGGMAFTNASLGITHSLAHALGGVFRVAPWPRQRPADGARRRPGTLIITGCAIPMPPANMPDQPICWICLRPLPPRRHQPAGRHSGA